MTRAFQGMGLALLAAYLYSLATMIIIGGAIGGILLTAKDRVHYQ